MKNIKALFLVLTTICIFGCRKENGNSIEVEKKTRLVRIESKGPISEYKIISRDTKKLIIHKTKPKYTNVTSGGQFNNISYEERIDLSSNELLTMQVPVTKDLKSFSLKVGGTNYSQLREDRNLNVYYIDFVSPADDYKD